MAAVEGSTGISKGRAALLALEQYPELCIPHSPIWLNYFLKYPAVDEILFCREMIRVGVYFD